MKKMVLAFLFMAKLVQGQINDSFSDGNFIDDPPWSGDKLQFEVNTSNQLHLNSGLADTSYLSTPNEQINNVSWSFWVKLSFNTSSNNFGRVYLVSDVADLEKSLHGYFVQIGGSDDSIRFFRQNGDTIYPVYCCQTYRVSHSTNTLRFKILRKTQGLWEAWIDTTGGKNFIRDGSFTDSIYGLAKWFGVFCKYTSSNSTKFYFDDFEVGPILYDNIPPEILSSSARDSLRIRIHFSEIINEEDAENVLHFFLTGSRQNPIMATLDPDSQSIVDLLFKNAMYSGVCDSLFIDGIRDVSGNIGEDTIIRTCYYLPHSFDVLIHEIMADPEPQAGLPAMEYVEIMNRTGFQINLDNWTFKIGKTEKIFPEVSLGPHGYLLLAKDTSLFAPTISCISLFTASSCLSNEGATLVLSDSQGHVIHAITYDISWYASSFKDEGGWSLEMIDALNPCGCQDNWMASIDPSGGTPGRINSVSRTNPDDESPRIVRAFFSDSTKMHIIFSESIDSSFFDHPGIFRITPGEFIPDSIFLSAPHYYSLDLKFSAPFEKGAVYTIHIAGSLYDCAGNELDTLVSAEAALPEEIIGDDIIINEILFNPYPGGSRFVELYNRSFKVIDLKGLLLATKDSSDWVLGHGTAFILESFLLFPNDYVAVTPFPEEVFIRYPGPVERQFLKAEEFPSLDNDSGTLVLARKDNGKIIDKIKYSSGMHYSLLSSVEGVSLERLNPDRTSSDPTNWHSASEASGFASPGYQNSQYFPVDLSTSSVCLTPLVFSPDNDGRDDCVQLSLRPEHPGFQAFISIYNVQGKEVRKLAENSLLSAENIFSWDGMTDQRTKAPVGLYIVNIELLSPEGSISRYKKVIVLAAIL